MIRKGIGVLVLVAVAYGGFRWGPLFFPHVERALGLGEPVWVPAPDGTVPEGPSVDLAERALDRFEVFRRGEGARRLALSGAELSSVVQFALPGIIPPGVTDPRIVLDDGRVQVSARVALEAFPRLPRLDQIAGILPDTVPIFMEGALVPLDQAFAALLIDRVEAARIPVPRAMLAEVLTGLGRDGPASLPSDALAVPIPDGVTAMFVQRDSLILEAGR